MMKKYTMITMIGLINRSYMKLNTLHTITICTSRLYCTYFNNNSVMLTSAIDSIYNKDWNVRGVTPFMKDQLLELVVREKYVFSPLQYFVLKKSDIPDFIYQILIMESKRGYLWIDNSVDDKWIHLIKPQNSTDLLLLMALSKVLLTLIDSNPNVYKLDEYYHDYYLNRMQNVCRLYKIDLSQSIKCIDKFDVLENIQFIGLNGVVFNLIKDFVSLPIFDAYLNKRIPWYGIPPIGKISNVIFDIFLINRFDREFNDRYPGVSYTRFGYEVFIATKLNDEFIIDEEEAEHFIDNVVRLHGDIDYIDQGDIDYFVGGSYQDKVIILDKSGRVSVLNYDEELE